MAPKPSKRLAETSKGQPTGPEVQFPDNPDSRDARGLSAGFQRQALTTENATRRDFYRVSLSTTTASTTTEAVSRASMRGFRSDSVTAVVEYVIVNTKSTSDGPVLVKMNTYQNNSLVLTQQGQGISAMHDTVVACVNPNNGYSFRPTPDSSGAQVSISNLLNTPINFTVTDATGALITDMTNMYLSIVFFERVH